MKNIFLLSLFFLFNAFCYSQSFSINELEKISKYNWDDFDTHVNNKHYIFDNEKTNERDESKHYAFIPNSYNNVAVKWITLYKQSSLNDISESIISWQTSSQIDYLNIKNQLKKSGYLFLKTGTFKEATFFKYKKGKKEISIYVFKAKNNNGENNITYEITLTNLR